MYKKAVASFSTTEVDLSKDLRDWISLKKLVFIYSNFANFAKKFGEYQKAGVMGPH
jgi:hypothetical protein